MVVFTEDAYEAYHIAKTAAYIVVTVTFYTVHIYQSIVVYEQYNDRC